MGKQKHQTRRIHEQTNKPARESLRKVEDPDTVEQRTAKRNRIKNEQKKKPRGPLGLSTELLQSSRTSLRRTENAPLVNSCSEEVSRDQSIDDSLRVLEGLVEDEIKSHHEQMVHVENSSGEEHPEKEESHNATSGKESVSQCIIS
mmetsp:Transcript_27325/g.56985  ORF Transcript_27325/g.56985 Transcript_27325/m.56985 type:complete len:146 (+) Transcript_27325:449-886(+)